MKRYLLTYSYIGTGFRGVQKKIDVEDKSKPDPESVQGLLEISLKRFCPANCPSVVVCSRTDKGVHALETAAHVDLEHSQGDNPLWPAFMTHGMNRYFSKAKADIWVKNIKAVPDTFHARYSAISRTYLYRLAVQKSLYEDVTSSFTISIPMGEWQRCCFIRNPNFELEKMKEAASLFIGLKDFRTFTQRVSHLPKEYSTVKLIHEMTVSPGQPLINSIYDSKSNLYNFWDIVVKAKSFNYRQVRRMVAVLVAVAQNRIEMDEVRRMIEDPHNNEWNPSVISKVDSMSFLREIATRKNNLRHCQTVITNALGESYLEDREAGVVTKMSDSSRGPGYVVDTKPDLQVAEIIPGLYLGSQDPTADKDLLQANGITHVLSLGVMPLDVPEKLFESKCDVQGAYSAVHPQTNITFVYIPFLDIPEASLIDVLPKCFPVIDSALSTSSKIFVHCNAGVSRSPSVILAYILYRSHFRKPWASILFKNKSDKPLSLLDTVELVRTKRQCIKPNSGFLDQLRQYECTLVQDCV